MFNLTIIAFIFLFSSLNILADNNENVFKISLRRQKFQRMSSAEIVQNQSAAAGVDIVSLHDEGDMAYTVTINLGNPPQEFVVQIDTGSSDFWVYGPDCCGGGNDWEKCPSKCARRNEASISNCPANCKYKFFPSESSTFKATDNHYFIKYGDGDNCSGPVGKDTLQIGSLILSDIGFGLANQSSVEIEKEAHFHGIMGMAFTKISESIPHKVDPPLIQAMKEKLLKENMFTVFMRNSPNGEEVDEGGVLTIGAFDNENCGQIIGWAGIVRDDGFWTIQIDNVAYRSDQFIFDESSPVLGISDTGTSLILGPKGTIEEIHAYLGVDPKDLTIPCDKEYDPIEFRIAGHGYEVTKEMLTLKNGDSCFFGMDVNKYETWNLGDPFIRQYCHVYDMANKRIGFAEVKKKN